MLQRICLSVAGVLFGLSSVAHAEQVVLVDVSYTHSADTTKDSHFYVKPPADAPKDWTKPIDYSTGSVHILIDVKTKPAGDTPTKFQICLEGTPAYACTTQSPTYTTTGRVEWDSPFKDFWYGGDVDWAQGIKQIPLILKDTNNGKPAGDPKYMPTDLHVQVTLVSPGAKFVPPPAAGSGAGGAGAGAGGSNAGAGGAASAGRGGASGGAGAAGSAGARSAAGAAAAGQGGAGSVAASGGAGAASTPTAGKAAAGTGAAGSSTTSNAGTVSPAASGTAGAVGTTTNPQTVAGDDAGGDDSGCRTTGSGSNGAWAVLAALGLMIAGRRRQRRA